MDTEYCTSPSAHQNHIWQKPDGSWFTDVWCPGRFIVKPSTNDDINNPKHYQADGVECIQVIEKLEFGYKDGNAMKYLWRHKYKGDPIKDIKKCIWYLQSYLKDLENEQ